jgi:hypothetical protein
MVKVNHQEEDRAVVKSYLGSRGFLAGWTGSNC